MLYLTWYDAVSSLSEKDSPRQTTNKEIAGMAVIMR